MVASASEAADRYRRGIEKIGGAAPYQEAARASSPQEAAETLENAKSQSLDVGTMVDQYREAYN